MRSDVENMALEGIGFNSSLGFRELPQDEIADNKGIECECKSKGKKKNSYESTKPYPEVKIKCKNKKYAEIISNDFAGAVSEMTATTQYVNHHIRCEEINEEIGEALLGISMVEMKHLEILGELILKLGGEPYYGRVKKDKFQCWTPKFINYGKDIKNMIKSDIQGEVEAIAQYKKHIEEIEDKNIQRILERIIEDEEVHIEVLDGLLKKLEK
ncbi:MAG: ferritin-like domain-containing protein [Clostridium sp.]